MNRSTELKINVIVRGVIQQSNISKDVSILKPKSLFFYYICICFVNLSGGTTYMHTCTHMEREREIPMYWFTPQMLRAARTGAN